MEHAAQGGGRPRTAAPLGGVSRPRHGTGDSRRRAPGASSYVTAIPPCRTLPHPAGEPQDVRSACSSGGLGGLHRAAHGAYKDAPYEGFYVGRFPRDIVIGVAALVCHRAGWCAGESLFVLLLVYFGIAYLVVEVWKLFFRYKDESEYRIPVRVHIGGRAVESPLVRWALAFAPVSSPSRSGWEGVASSWLRTSPRARSSWSSWRAS